MHICSKGVDFCSKGRELWLKGGVLCPLNIGIFSNSLATSELQNLTMFEGLKNLPFEQKTVPFEHLGRFYREEPVIIKNDGGGRRLSATG
jgi:hypothetical protein